MYYLAFDVSINKLDGVLTNLKTKTEYFSIANNHQSMVDWLNKTKLPKKIVCGCESTGGYHLLIMKIFVEKEFAFKLINPLLVKQFTRTTIRKKKTDLSDSLIIAKLLAQGEGQIISFNDLDLTAKTQQRGLRKLIKEKHRFSLMSQSLRLQENKNLFSLERRYEKLEKTIEEGIKEYTLF